MKRKFGGLNGLQTMEKEMQADLKKRRERSPMLKASGKNVQMRESA